MIKKISLIYNTVKHLKPIQVFYQFKYRIHKAGSLSSYNKTYFKDKYCLLKFNKQPPIHKVYLGNNKFKFLNLIVSFGSEIDWNYQVYGKLWNYNLQYANYLMQEGISVRERKTLLLSLYKAIDRDELILEPYPVSLRSINTIRFFSYNQIEDESLYSYLHAELDFLSKRLEYHLLGNHLLENGFALIMGGAFFNNKIWIKQGREILEEQLEEQLMKDGAHFELSPMYHQIIFFRLLELIDWYSNWKFKEDLFFRLIKNKAKDMRSWLEAISFKNGDIPHFNDSANGIAYSTIWLLSYAYDLDITSAQLPLAESGYRSFENFNYECKVDVAQLGTSYQPGHAHADALSFILYCKDNPVFVEQGTSTYNIGERRNLERSTSAHNTVVVKNQNQSQVWSGFRVANRANTTILKDEKNNLSAFHNGYRALGIKHSRSFDFKGTEIIIEDRLGDKINGVFYLHLHPSLNFVLKTKNRIIVDTNIEIHFTNGNTVKIEDYQFAKEYNNYIKGVRLVVEFQETLKTSILFKEHK